jgi:hypothetical protein
LKDNDFDKVQSLLNDFATLLLIRCGSKNNSHYARIVVCHLVKVWAFSIYFCAFSHLSRAGKVWVVCQNFLIREPKLVTIVQVMGKGRLGGKDYPAVEVCLFLIRRLIDENALPRW